MGRPVKILTKEMMLKAMEMTLSNRAAARYLCVSFGHYKKYAKLYKDDKTGKTLWETHKNQAGRRIPKCLKEFSVYDLLEGKVAVEHFEPRKIKTALINEGLIEEQCSRCGFRERRVIDGRVPLIVVHKDGNRKNWKKPNLEMMCYNCSFLYAVSPITDKQVEKMEDYLDIREKEYDWELDEYHIEHLKSIGLWKDETPGSEYVTYN